MRAAKQELARLLRGWWEQDTGKITQEALARRVSERGARTSQEMLSRYLHRTRPTLARPDVIRAMHEVLGRTPEELAEALALHAEASAPATEPPAPAGLRPAPDGPPPGPEGREPVSGPLTEGAGARTAPAGSGAAAARAVAGGAGGPGAPADREAPSPASLAGTSPADVVPGRDAGPTRSRRGRPWLAVAAAAAVGVTVLTGTMSLRDAEGPQKEEQDKGKSAAVSASPTITAECRGESCFGIDPKYSICREDAATYYTGNALGVRVELRFSPTCQAAWAKMTGTSQGDVIRVTNNAGRSRHYTQQWGHDAHSTMVSAMNPDDAKACARTPRGEVCATAPVTSPAASTDASASARARPR
ncbi:DUF2690 domain-containing protein [Streptomyces fradiae]|uniref:DUF2690 domain-containing protein n=1 Tax=Streptomyces fradiae TaxID=1906 RepID=UPI0035BE8FCA